MIAGPRRMVKNMPSASAKSEVTDGYLAEECSKGRVLVSLNPALCPGIHVNCFGVIAKGSTGRW